MVEYRHSSMEERGEELDVRYDGLNDGHQHQTFVHEIREPTMSWACSSETFTENSDPRLGSYLLTENFMMEVARRPNIWREAPACPGDSWHPPSSSDATLAIPHSADQCSSYLELGGSEQPFSPEQHSGPPHHPPPKPRVGADSPDRRERFTTFVT